MSDSYELHEDTLNRAMNDRHNGLSLAEIIGRAILREAGLQRITLGRVLRVDEGTFLPNPGSDPKDVALTREALAQVRADLMREIMPNPGPSVTVTFDGTAVFDEAGEGPFSVQSIHDIEDPSCVIEWVVVEEHLGNGLEVFSTISQREATAVAAALNHVANTKKD